MDIWTDPLNHTATDTLVRSLRRRQGLIPFVGAGFSFDYRFPLWSAFLVDTARGVGLEAIVRAALRRSDFELAAQLIADAIGVKRFDTLIGETFGRPVDLAAAPSAAVLELPALATGPVLTTNYDRVLETVFRAAGKTFELPLWGARVQLALDGLAEDYPLLLKLHGDALHHEHVLTRESYKLQYGSGTPDQVDVTRPLPRLLERLFVSRSMLFLGCSLYADRPMVILRRLTEQSIRSPQHFALLQHPGSAEQFAQTRSRLQAHGITPIWYPPGQHTLIRPFLRALADRMPDITRSSHMPGPAPGGLSTTAEIARRRARRAAVALAQDKQRLLIEWANCRSPAQRRDFLRTHNITVQENWPETLLRIASRVVREQRHADPATAAFARISMYWAAMHLGKRASARRAMQDAIGLLKASPPSVQYVDLLHTQAVAARREANERLAELFSRVALRSARSIEWTDPLPLRRIHALRAVILFQLGKRRRARWYLALALRSARSSGHREDIATYLMRASNFHFTEDRPAAMALAARRGLNIAEPAHLGLRAMLSDNLGVALYELGRYPEALAAYREALWYEQEGEGDPRAIIITLMNLAWLDLNAFAFLHKVETDRPKQLRDASLRRAHDYYGQARAYAEMARDNKSRAHIDTQDALVMASLGKIGPALALLRRAIRFFKVQGDLGYLATAYNNRGQIWRHVPGEQAREIAACRRALALARKAGEPGILRTILANSIDAYHRAGDEGQANDCARELASIA